MAGDEVYGADPRLRRELEDRGTGYVLAVACSHQVTTAAGRQRADAIAASLSRRSWQRKSAGRGSKGPRYYDWAWITIDPGTVPAGQCSLLIRRNDTTGELAYQQRDPPPAQRPPRPAGPQHRKPPALVHLAAAAPAPRQDQPLPTTSTNMKITRRSSLGCPVQLRSD